VEAGRKPGHPGAEIDGRAGYSPQGDRRRGEGEILIFCTLEAEVWIGCAITLGTKAHLI